MLLRMGELQFLQDLASQQRSSLVVQAREFRWSENPTLAAKAPAVFTYAYGDFPGDPLKLLAKHYDAMHVTPRSRQVASVKVSTPASLVCPCIAPLLRLDPAYAGGAVAP